MEKFEKVSLGVSKRPTLLDTLGELEEVSQEGVALYDRNEKTKYSDGTARLTTHRIIWHNDFEALALSLAHVVSMDLQAGFLTSSPKISINLGGDAVVKLSFRSGGQQQYFSKLQQAVAAAAWKKKLEPPKPQKTEFDPSKAGIGGILASAEENKKKTSETLELAFSDLSALMSKAADLVAIAEKLTKKIEKEGDEEENSQMRSYLIELGISSPVTRESAGSAYHKELSKQLAEFLEKALKREGGTLTLPDLYCIFNRARGTALISPEDLYRACLLFEELGLSFRMKKLKSGVLLVQTVGYDDNAMQSRILRYIQEKGSLTALDFARMDRISVIIAKEQLLTTEQAGLICRDESMEGIRYYENLIKTFQFKQK